jgi:solute carrier family 34 (sodium-dependent phosphate cotransporter)
MVEDAVPVKGKAGEIAVPLAGALQPGVAARPETEADEVAPEGRRDSVRWLKAAYRAALVVLALWCFIIALNLIKSGAAGLKPVLNSLAGHGVLGHLGFGWLGSYLVLSGSPIAAVSLSLFAGGAQSDTEAFAMINGSRLGASLIVLLVGFLSYVRGRRSPDGLYIGVVALLTAITLWSPALPAGLLILNKGWLNGVYPGGHATVSAITNQIANPVVTPIVDALPRLAVFGAGVAVLMTSFTVFDRALPNLENPGPGFERLSRVLHQRFAMFAFGSLVTLMTMSVSLSVTLLVPLALKGYVRRDRVIPYVMGANITTWIDTLFAAMLLNSPHAFTIVLTEMVTGGAISLVVLFVFYKPYTAAILWLAHRVSTSRKTMAAFLGCIFITPVVLLLL